ncbi:MAG: right-handed parallel beta-helix repeat-containing protein [Holophagaceae bacterium]|nr:right-handed parallel beta-helix repeat-containing protein [Holophagaceae bacterium]
MDLQEAIRAAKPGTVLDLQGRTFEGSFRIDRSVTLRGGTIRVSAGAHGLHVLADQVTLDGLTLQGGQNGIWAEHVNQLEVRNCTIQDAAYSGIMILSGHNCRVTNNTIQRIGLGKPAGTNAYGIALSARESGNLEKDPMTCAVTVTGNRVSDIPTWHGIDTHGGQRLAILDNTIERVSRPIFITSLGSQRPREIEIRGNRILSPGPVTYNLVPLTLVEADEVTISGNLIQGWGGHSPRPEAPYLDYGAASRRVVVDGSNWVER